MYIYSERLGVVHLGRRQVPEEGLAHASLRRARPHSNCNDLGDRVGDAGIEADLRHQRDRQPPAVTLDLQHAGGALAHARGPPLVLQQ